MPTSSVSQWTFQEVQALLDIMLEVEMGRLLPNERVFQNVSEKMAAKGYQRTSVQCRTKCKKLRSNYRKAIDGGIQRWRWFQAMEAIYGSSVRSTGGSAGGLQESSEDDKESCDSNLVSSTATSNKQEDLGQIKSEEELLAVTVTGKEDFDDIKMETQEVGSPRSCLPSTDCSEDALQIRKHCRDVNREGRNSENPVEHSLSILNNSMPFNVNPSEDELHSISELVSIPLNVVRRCFVQKRCQENTEQAERISEEWGGASEPGSSSPPNSSHVDTQMTIKMEPEDIQQLSEEQDSSSVSAIVAESEIPSLITNHLGNSSDAYKPSTRVAQKSEKTQHTERQKRKRPQSDFLSEMLALEKKHHKEYMEQQRRNFQLTMEEARLSREAEMALRREEAATTAAFHQAFLNVLGKIAEGLKPQSTPPSLD